MVKKIALGMLLLGMTGISMAKDTKKDADTSLLTQIDQFITYVFEELSSKPPSSGVVTAPEIDPSSAIAGLTLLLGGLAVIRGRRITTSND